MFCPQCGQQQVTGVIRFCSRCGFPLDGVIQLLNNGGMIPAYQRDPDEPVKMSPRKRGVKQGGLLLLSGAVLVPILAMFASFASGSTFLEILAALAAIVCFIGGPLRMLYAGVFEEGAPPRQRLYGTAAPMHVPQQFVPHMQAPALPPPQMRPATSWRRPNTAELANPPSVTENTTRLLDKEDRTSDH
jgi:hypothetical protein